MVFQTHHAINRWPYSTSLVGQCSIFFLAQDLIACLATRLNVVINNHL